MDNMDVFFEQIIGIKKTGKTILAFSGIWALAALLILFLFFTNLLGGLTLILCFGIGYGAYWLSSKLNVEFEYIITNGTMDIDKITNKSSRKRILSFELSKVTRLEKYNSVAVSNISPKEIVFACNQNDENAYFMNAERNGKGNVNLVFSPNDKIKSAIEKFAPKFITNNAFKN